MFRSRTSILRPLRHRDFRLLLTSLAVSATGDWLYSVALVVFVFDETESATWVAISTAARLVPFVLLSTLGGVIADHYDRRRVLIVADVVRALLMFVMAAVVFTSGPVIVAVILATLSTAAATPAGPSMASAIPTVLGEEDLAVGNSLRETIENLALLAGPAAGGLLLAVMSPGGVIVLNGLSFLLSIVFIARMRLPARDAGDAGDEPASLHTRVTQGLDAIRSDRGITAIVGVIGAVTFLYGMTSVLYVVAAEELLGWGPEGFGYLQGAAGLGGLLAAALTGRLADNHDPGRALLAAGVLIAVPTVTLGVTGDPWIALLVLLLEGGAGIVVDVLAITMLQRSVDQQVLGRVLGMIDSVAGAGTLLGVFVAPAAIGWFGVAGALVCCGAMTAAGVAALARWLLSAGRAARARAEELADVVALVECMDIFRGAGRTTIEGVATALEPVRVVAGDVVVREGEVADAMYLIESGAFGVCSSGGTGGPAVHVNDLAAGDYLGEIGLLQGIPRTATVRCTAAGRVYRLDGDRFLEVVTQSPAISGLLRAGAAARLARTHPPHQSASEPEQAA